MSSEFLQKVTAETLERVNNVRNYASFDRLKNMAEQRRVLAEPNALTTALKRDAINIIAEFKRASPSKGIINDQLNAKETARQYQIGGAAAISVLTEPTYFKGSLNDLIAVRETVSIPILRKDFTVDEFQIYEAAAAGADAILLIVAALKANELTRMLEIVRELKMDAIVEVHTDEEMQTANETGADIIGVNNRDLKTLDVSLDTSRRLIGMREPETLMIAESGLTSRVEIDELRKLGYNGFLIGETLMRSSDIPATLGGLIA